jgi:hypothetical protein
MADGVLLIRDMSGDVMVDMVKKVHKKGGELLNAGETVLGAATVTEAGQFKKSVAFGAIGGAVGAAVGHAMKGKGDEADAGTMADSWPQMKQSILALSDQRWILFEQGMMSGGPKSVVAEWPHSAIQGIEIEKGKLTSKLNVIFSDGSAAQVEAVKGAKPEKLVEAAAAL